MNISLVKNSLALHYSDFYRENLSDSPSETRETVVKFLLGELHETQLPLTIIDLGSGRRELEVQLLRAANQLMPLERKKVKETLAQSKYITTDFCDIKGKKLPIQTRQRDLMFHGRIDHQRLPFPNESADVVVSNMSLDFSLDKLQALSEVARVLKPGGRAFFNFHHPSLIENFKKFNHKILSHPFLQFVMNTEHFYPNEESIQSDMQEARFSHIEVNARNSEYEQWWEVSAVK